MADVALLPYKRDIPAKGTEHFTGKRAVLQRAELRFRLFKGDDPLDESVGIPFLEWFQEKTPDPGEVAAVFEEEFEGIDGIVRSDVSIEQDGDTLRGDGTIDLEEDGERELVELTIELEPVASGHINLNFDV